MSGSAHATSGARSALRSPLNLARAWHKTVEEDLGQPFECFITSASVENVVHAPMKPDHQRAAPLGGQDVALDGDRKQDADHEGAAQVDDERPERKRVGISKHLRVLERAGLVERGRQAQWRPRRLRAEPLKEAAAWVGEYRRHWEEHLDRLDDFLKRMDHEPDGHDRKDRRHR